jgi:oligo-1,6-glucosidase
MDRGRLLIRGGNRYSKGVEFLDAPIIDPAFYEQPAWLYYANGPRIHEFMREMNDKVLKHYDAVTVGELPHTPDPKKVLDYVRTGDKQLSMVFQFDIVDIGQGVARKYQFEPWKLPVLKGIITKWQQFIEGTDGWTTAFCENHGTPPPPSPPLPPSLTPPPQTKAAPSPATPPTPPNTASTPLSSSPS